MGLDFYEVYLEIEEEFDVRIMDKVESVPAETVGELFDVVLQSVRQQHPEQLFRDADSENLIWQQYVTLLVEQLGLRREQIVPSAYFVRDLKIY